MSRRRSATPPEMSPLVRQCLDATVPELSDELRGVFSPETVGGYVAASYEQVGERRAVGPDFLPVIIERFAREQLWAVAQSTGLVSKPLPGGQSFWAAR